MKIRWMTLVSVMAMATLLLSGNAPATAAPEGSTNFVYLPFIRRDYGCPATSSNSYAQGPAYQWDADNPVRPAWNHADKNISLRSYDQVSQFEGYINLPSDDPNVPQLGSLFTPDRLPVILNTYAIHHWNWANPPNPGTRGGIVTDPPVTVVGFQTTPGEVLSVPPSNYDIGGGMEVIILFADADTVAMKYTREDSSQPNGYLIHVDGICTDPNLLALYNALDTGARYVPCGGFGCSSYNLVNLPANHPIGTALATEIRMMVVDTGTSLDIRSCNDWWQNVGGAPCN